MSNSITRISVPANDATPLVSGLRGKHQITLQGSSSYFLVSNETDTVGLLLGSAVFQFEADLDSTDVFYAINSASVTVTVMVTD